MKKQQTISNVQYCLDTHQTFLKKFNFFPEKTRKVIYSQLLQIPINHDHFTQLTKQYSLLPQHTLDQQVILIVGALSRLYPDLGNQWLPGIVYPFAKLFKQDSIAIFEISLTFLANWYRPIFTNYPNPSKQLMKWFSKHLYKLQNKVNSLQYPLSALINPLFIVNLTDIFNKDQWLQLYDFLFAHPYTPEYILCIIVELLSGLQNMLSKYDSIQKIALALRKQKKVNITDLINRAKNLAKIQKDALKQLYNGVFFPLPKGRYPILSFVEKSIYTNELLERSQDLQIEKLSNKYNDLKQIVNNKLQHGLCADEKDINKRYEDVQGQMKQYLNQVKQQHQRKIMALKQIQNKFKQEINVKGSVNRQIARQAIQRRGRLERQIDMVTRQADSIRLMQIELLNRINDTANIRKKQLERQNKFLYKQQNY